MFLSFCVLDHYFHIKKKQVFGYYWSTLLWYWCYYPHRSRDALSPVCKIFSIEVESVSNHIKGIFSYIWDKSHNIKIQSYLGQTKSLSQFRIILNKYVRIWDNRKNHIKIILSLNIYEQNSILFKTHLIMWRAITDLYKTNILLFLSTKVIIR